MKEERVRGAVERKMVSRKGMWIWIQLVMCEEIKKPIVGFSAIPIVGKDVGHMCYVWF